MTFQGKYASDWKLRTKKGILIFLNEVNEDALEDPLPDLSQVSWSADIRGVAMIQSSANFVFGCVAIQSFRTVRDVSHVSPNHEHLDARA
jgi:hypothetical protein